MWANNEVGTVQPIAAARRDRRRGGASRCTPTRSRRSARCRSTSPRAEWPRSPSPVTSSAARSAWAPCCSAGTCACTPLLHGGGQERDVRSGTLDAAGIVAFAVAVEAAVNSQREYAARVAALRDDLVKRLIEVVPEVVHNGDPVDRLPGNAHFSFPGCEGDALLLLLDAQGIACSTGSACSAGVAQPSHVLLAMGADDDRARSSLRFALGHTSTVGRRRRADRRAAGGGGAGPPGRRDQVRPPLTARAGRLPSMR